MSEPEETYDHAECMCVDGDLCRYHQRPVMPPTEPRADDPAALVATARVEHCADRLGDDDCEPDSPCLILRLADALAAMQDGYRRAVAQEEAWQDACTQAREREATLVRHLKRYHPTGECEILQGLDPLPLPDDWTDDAAREPLREAVVEAAVAYRKADRWSTQGPALSALQEAADAYLAVQEPPR